jgi:hypothetical protein
MKEELTEASIASISSAFGGFGEKVNNWQHNFSAQPNFLSLFSTSYILKAFLFHYPKKMPYNPNSEIFHNKISIFGHCLLI